MTSYSEILFFWFLNPSLDPAYLKERMPLWFGGGGKNDDIIRERFGDMMAPAIAGELDSWADVAKGRMGLIIILDQFSRMLYRGTGRAFAQDAKARELCLEGLERGQDKRLSPIERVFFYLPLMHSENLEDQDRCVALLSQLAEDVPPEGKQAIESNIDYGVRHRDVIREFGRFPHRNKALGRENTPEEELYLKQPGAGF